MIQITEHCLRELSQEPGGSLCVQYRYRVEDTSLEEYLELKGGNAIIEFTSNHKLLTKKIGELLGIDSNRIHIVH